ncbi:MAG: hypothetical protein JNK05_36210 [Myxococcales bacterium]|nr:hypothetical protein [Myxococcales bacterium]
MDDDARDRTHLPSQTRREQLLDRLSDIIARAGVEPFVAWPLILPDASYFPDRFDPKDDRTILRLVRRLLWYAGLEALRVELHIIDEIDRAEATTLLPIAPHREAVAWFAGIRDDTCWFGVFRARLASSEEFVTAMAHEVAHAYRHLHGLEVANEAAEEELTDLTTVFLGFGVLSTNGAYTYRSSGGLGGILGHQYSHRSLGYLSPDALSFALAAQCFVREYTREELAHVRALLEPNQRASFEAALEYFDDIDESLVARLGLPPRSEWPPHEDLDSLVAMDTGQAQDQALAADLALSAASESSSTAAALSVATFTRRTPFGSLTFPRDATLHGVLAGIGLAVAAIKWIPHGGLLGLSLPVVGYLVGRSIPLDRCGTDRCFARVRVNHRCPKCGEFARREGHPWL